VDFWDTITLSVYKLLDVTDLRGTPPKTRSARQ
jgi:hypothetical protein